MHLIMGPGGSEKTKTLINLPAPHTPLSRGLGLRTSPGHSEIDAGTVLSQTHSSRGPGGLFSVPGASSSDFVVVVASDFLLCSQK